MKQSMDAGLSDFPLQPFYTMLFDVILSIRSCVVMLALES